MRLSFVRTICLLLLIYLPSFFHARWEYCNVALVILFLLFVFLSRIFTDCHCHISLASSTINVENAKYSIYCLAAEHLCEQNLFILKMTTFGFLSTSLLRYIAPSLCFLLPLFPLLPSLLSPHLPLSYHLLLNSLIRRSGDPRSNEFCCISKWKHFQDALRIDSLKHAHTSIHYWLTVQHLKFVMRNN